MQVKLVNREGDALLLPETLSLQGWPEQTELPSIEIQGLSGEYIDDPLIRMKARDLVVSGTIAAEDRGEADEIRERISSFCSRLAPHKLYRSADDGRYMMVYKRGINHGYVTGRYGGRVFTLSIEFRATDPYFYAEDITQVTQQVSSTLSTQKWNITQGGTVEGQQPIICIKARSGSLVNPSIRSGTIQLVINGTVTQSKAVVLNCERRIALVTDGDLDYYLKKWGVGGDGGTGPSYEENIINGIKGNWPVYGFPLPVGESEVTYTDDLTSSHNADVTIAWRPKYY